MRRRKIRGRKEVVEGEVMEVEVQRRSRKVKTWSHCSGGNSYPKQNRRI